MTKGIILSGGWGTRLRPLTCTIPKTLMPVCNIPVIERQMLLLKKIGVTEMVLAVSIMADSLKNHFKDGSKLGIKIHYTDEKTPMGTAGAVKLAEDQLKDDNFFMLNGDVILNFDFQDMLNSHKKYGGTATIAGKTVEDPSRYGVLIVDEETQRITKFLEKSEYKPPKGEIIPMPINAGVIILEPEIFSYIKLNKEISMEKEIYPILASENKLYHYPISGIWLDIGKPKELLEGNIILMNDLLKNMDSQNIIDDSVSIEGKALIYPPVTIGKNVVIKKNCVIGPNVIIGDNVFIDDNTTIKEALIYNETYIAKNVKIDRAIISNDCHIHDKAILQGNEKNIVILASNVEVLANIRLIAHEFISLSICHHEIIRESKSM